MVTRTRKGTPSFPANAEGAIAFRAEQACPDRRKSWETSSATETAGATDVLISLFAAGFFAALPCASQFLVARERLSQGAAKSFLWRRQPFL